MRFVYMRAFRSLKSPLVVKKRVLLLFILLGTFKTLQKIEYGDLFLVQNIGEYLNTLNRGGIQIPIDALVQKKFTFPL